MNLTENQIQSLVLNNAWDEVNPINHSKLKY